MARILCVDDEPAALRLRAQILERSGHSVTTATTVDEALRKFRADPFDLVVSDHILGRGTGTHLASQLRRLKPEVPILILSGTTEIPADIEHADAFLSKLEGPRAFLEKIAGMLELAKTPPPVSPSEASPPTSEEMSHAYEELRVSQARLAAIIDSTMDAIITVDEEQRVVLFNRAAERIFGYRAQQLMGQPLDILIPEDLRAAHRVHIRNFGHTGITSRSMYSPRTLNALRSDGEQFPIEATISQVEAAGQKLYTVVLRDLSERKRAEEELRKAEKLAVAGRMAATVAHEINNPLETVLNALFLIEQATSLDHQTRDLVTTAQEELQRVTQITKLTLGFYRQDERLQSAVIIPDVIDNVLALYGRKFQLLGIEVEKHYDTHESLPAVAGELRQVFSNLILNAADALSTSGTRLLIRVRHGLNWSTMRAGINVVICDNGPGIPAPVRSRLFQLFQTTKGEKGTGLGLWVSQGIIKAHGGSIRCRSSVRPGASGTTFRIFLPTEPKPVEVSITPGDIPKVA
ncbi:MAG: PAS domain S-box protein [Terriglobales bacterium]